jgi:hypothetical protein
MIGIINKNTIMELKDIEKNEYYIDPETNERVKTWYTVTFLSRSIGGASVEIAATSKKEALELALDVDTDKLKFIDPEYTIVIDEDVEVEEPPEGALRVEVDEYKSEATV